MGLSQSLPVTSYIKMIDIWMLFTMTIPFLEVVLHTTHEMFKNTKASQIVPETSMYVLEVDSGEEKEEVARTNLMKLIMSKMMGNLMLPIGSLVFTVIFWVVGPILANSSGDADDVNMSDCLTSDLA